MCVFLGFVSDFIFHFLKEKKKIKLCGLGGRKDLGEMGERKP